LSRWSKSLARRLAADADFAAIVGAYVDEATA